MQKKSKRLTPGVHLAPKRKRVAQRRKTAYKLFTKNAGKLFCTMNNAD